MEGHSSQLVVFGAVAISLIVLLRRLRTLEATLADPDGRTRCSLQSAEGTPTGAQPARLYTYCTCAQPQWTQLSYLPVSPDLRSTAGTPHRDQGKNRRRRRQAQSLRPAAARDAALHLRGAAGGGAAAVRARVLHVAAEHVPTTLWPEWRRRQAQLTETPLTLPGVPATSYSSSPVDIPPADAALTAEAHAAAAALPAEHLQLGVCGMGWTVTAPGSNLTHASRPGRLRPKYPGCNRTHQVLARAAEPWRGLPLTPLRQLSVADYLLCTSPCGLWVASG